MASSTQAADVAASVSELTIGPTNRIQTSKTQNPKSKKHVVDSWEDEDASSGPEDAGSRPSTSGPGVKEGTTAPPPTPISPNYNIPEPFAPIGYPISPDGDSAGSSRRPDKTDAVARRMIASALGVKVPKQTEEQKAYDKALREKERKRRDEGRAADKKRQEELEKAKKAIWED